VIFRGGVCTDDQRKKKQSREVREGLGEAHFIGAGMRGLKM